MRRPVKKGLIYVKHILNIVDSAIKSLLSALSGLVLKKFSPTLTKPTTPIWYGPSTTPVRSMKEVWSAGIVGVAKGRLLSKAIEKHVSIWDWDQEILVAPPYYGQLIDQLLSVKKTWPDESTFMGHFHTVLYDLTMKSALYYHTNCVDVPSHDDEDQPYGSLKDFSSVSLSETRSRRSNSDTNLMAKSSSPSGKEQSRKLLARFNLHKQDFEIIENFAEIVKEQIALEFNGGNPVVPIRLDYSQCETFKSHKK